jgi:hypothetical protein
MCPTAHSMSPSVSIVMLLFSATDGTVNIIGLLQLQMGRAARSMRPCQEATRLLARLFEDGVAAEPAGGRFGKGNYDRMKASRSALITSSFVVHMPCGKPGYTLSVPFLSSLA